MSKTIYVRDYVTLPCEDAAEPIRRALADARPEGTQLLSVPQRGYRALLLSEEYGSAVAALFP